MGLPDTLENARGILSNEFVAEGKTRHLRVFAGPGAGKTHWIDTQVRGLIESRLIDPAVQKIACISYTNVAVETLTARLGEASTTSSVFTVHSFLYSNVVKPYVHLVRGQNGSPLIESSRLEGHDEPRSGYKLVEEWRKRIPKNLPSLSTAQRSKVENYLEKLHWIVQDDELRVASRSEWQPVKYFPTTCLFEYKQTVWDFGRLEHDDVFYFSWRILKENPGLRDMLSARFPFIIVDEFQDTNPIQLQILKWLAGAGSIITVVGDVAQSIYDFQGAKPDQFFEFELDDVIDLKIEGNRRSTNAIIDQLNRLRNDGLKQQCLRAVDGHPVTVIVGSITDTLAAAESALPSDEKLFCLARTNRDVAVLRNKGRLAGGTDLWDELRVADPDRFTFLKRVCSAVALEKTGNYVPACRELLRLFRPRSSGEHRKPLKAQSLLDEDQQRAAALALLISCKSLRTSDGSCCDAYGIIGDILSGVGFGLKLVALSRGAAFELLQKVKFSSLLIAVKLNDDRRAGQTIHKAKGAEFDNVFVSLETIERGKTKSRVSHLLSPTSAEEHRISYVGFSRARNRLFVQLPFLNEADEKAARAFGLDIVKATRESI